jgi:DNA-binding NarL/FixJ family response regulator
VGAPPLRLLVVGEDALARAGLRALAEGAFLGVILDIAPAELEGRTDHDADVAVWDVGPHGSLAGLHALAKRLPVVALLWSEDQAPEALAEGARAVLLREHLEGRLVPAIEAALAGLVTLDEPLAEAALRSPARSLPEPLTPRETEVLQLVAEGLTNRRIGERLGISEHTAKFHVNAILGKLGARSRSEAVAAAARLGLLLL